MNEEERLKQQARALADTLTSWQKQRPEDLDELSEHLNFDAAAIEVENEEVISHPPPEELPPELRDLYRQFLEDWAENLESGPSGHSPSREDPGSITDFLIGLIERRR